MQDNESRSPHGELATVIAQRDRQWGETIDEFLAGDEAAYDWLVPGLLERGDRLILTGGEGHGKSTLLRQLAVQASAGIPPLGGESFEPLRVLLVDLENSRRQLRRQLRPLRLAAGGGLDGKRLRIAVRPEGIDLLGCEDRRWLATLIEVHRPDLVIIGPNYKMFDGDPCEEKPSKAATKVLDALRERHRFALAMEAHQRHAAAKESRPLRPYGASIWTRWPEFGLHLGEDGALTHWRGPRDERQWPPALRRGGEWPWTVGDAEPVGATNRARILAAVAAQPWALTKEEVLTEAGSKSQYGRKAFELLVEGGSLAAKKVVRSRADGKPHQVQLWGPSGGPSEGILFDGHGESAGESAERGESAGESAGWDDVSAGDDF